MIRNAIIFIICRTSFLYMENKVKSGCKKTFKTNLISLLHNFGSIYLFFGSYLFGYHLFHLLTLIIVVILWKVYSMCIVTNIIIICVVYLQEDHFMIYFI